MRAARRVSLPVLARAPGVSLQQVVHAAAQHALHRVGRDEFCAVRADHLERLPVRHRPAHGRIVRAPVEPFGAEVLEERACVAARLFGAWRDSPAKNDT